jgi:hypothetical protein
MSGNTTNILVAMVWMYGLAEILKLLNRYCKRPIEKLAYLLGLSFALINKKIVHNS